MKSTFLLLLLSLFTTSVTAQVYYKNVCNDKQVASWQKMNDQMKQVLGQDHPQIKKKLDYCERFNQAIAEGQCKEAITKDSHGRSAETQLKNGGPYIYCLQDWVRE